ncbi:RNA recognition motif domain [Trypanosoma melophagium]|uniref:RNA recognition motif domain n=1 Tax=Trypanosoma melophagium TaxID=715481 RepID=UPI00351A4BA9|nr:RNA recognition motif domain [Trypanosoma melophagium]
MAQVPLVSQYDPYSQSAQQLQQLQQPQQPQSQQVPAQMNAEPDLLRNLMVNYIPTTVDEVQLRQLFERFGPIESVKIVCDRESRQSRGFGFVKFQSASSAQQAITGLNGFSILNKRLKVALAANGHQRNRNNAAGGFGPYGGYGGYGAYPPAANPYAQQQMMAMYQQYMMQVPQQSQPQGQLPQQQMPAIPQQQQQQQQAPGNRPARK